MYDNNIHYVQRKMEYTKETLYAFKKKQDNKTDKRPDDGGGGGFGGFGVSEVCFIIHNNC